MRYFAYGSNLLTARLAARVPHAKFIHGGHIAGWRFAFNLRSTDGSAKANAINTNSPQDALHGAIYELDELGKSLLDQFEDLGGAYQIAAETAETEHGHDNVFLYVGNPIRLAQGLPPYDWYLALILAGAREHDLPADLVQMLQTCPTIPDPDSNRATINWNLIPAHLR
ncbi:gamma-glutamylcyclotransferase [bacterium]|nr:gamma-glutamylcyclotransferase [bacterium]